MRMIPIPGEPLRVALIGAGNRSRAFYAPVLRSLQPWVSVTAVCDPVREHAGALGNALGARAYTSVIELVRDRPMEAALIVTPIDGHHALSVYLSSHGVHNHTETSWANLVCQAQDMIAVARRNAVVVRVAENFFRFPVDRFAQALKRDGYLGRIGRVVSYADHTGYHNNSRWIVFAGARPSWVQCVEHGMAHPAFYSMPQRRHERETLNARFFGFPDGFLVMDAGSGHVKGHLGRHPRPGYTEWHGERGTLMHRATSATWGRRDGLQTEVRYVSDDNLAPRQEAAGRLSGGGIADVITPVVTHENGHDWLGTYADTPRGRIGHTNELRLREPIDHPDGWYGVALMDHVIDFVLAVRGLRASEFSDEDALMSQMMEAGAHESALRDGARVALPLAGAIEADEIARRALREKHGVDPLDVEAMLSISYPRP